jgi:molecular chaperone GrpE
LIFYKRSQYDFFDIDWSNPMADKIEKDWKAFKDENQTPDFMDEDALAPEASRAETSSQCSYAELEEQLALSEKKAHENFEKAVRAMAEADNVRRRASLDVSQAHQYALERFSNALLPVVDSLEQAIQLAEKSADSAMHEGLMLTEQLFLNVLTKFNVHQLNPMGELFDPQRHEAMTMQESAEVAANTILMVFQKGYLLHERVIRPARVVVSKEKKA